MRAEDWPDKTLTELQEDDEFDHEERIHTQEEVEEMRQEVFNVFEIRATGSMLARMVENDDITLKEYADLSDILMEYESDLDATLL